MPRFVEGSDRKQVTLLPECLDDYIGEDNPVRVIEAFVEELDLEALGFEGMRPAFTGRPSYHPAVLLKIYIYGYLNRIQSSRRLERECQRNVELMWLTGRLRPCENSANPRDVGTAREVSLYSGVGDLICLLGCS
jgi:transposase